MAQIKSICGASDENWLTTDAVVSWQHILNRIFRSRREKSYGGGLCYIKDIKLMAKSISGASIDFFLLVLFASFGHVQKKKVLVHNVSEWLAGVENFYGNLSKLFHEL
jgi:hypothetical protein